MTVGTEEQRFARAEALRLDPRAAVVLVVDPQNDFCHPDGAHGRLGTDLSHAQAALARLGPFLDAARSAGVPVVFVRTLHDETVDTPAWDERHLDPARPRTCVTGSWGAEFCEVAPLPGEPVVVKHRYSAFAGTGLARLLRERGRLSVLFTGFATGVCVESSLREAVSRDLLATLVEDCCGDVDESAHARAATAVSGGFGLVTTGDRIVDAWRTGMRGGAGTSGTKEMT